MSESHRKDQGRLQRVRGEWRVPKLVAACATVAVVALALGVPAGIASTTTVYWDNSNNVGAGPFPFNGTFTGTDNIATGPSMMQALTTGDFNVASGSFALNSNTSGSYNVATGTEALYSNTSGPFNSATGWHALHDNVTGSENTATGEEALQHNTNGYWNTATGALALRYNTAGRQNVADGYGALFDARGNNNVAIGYNALFAATSGGSNTALGSEAGSNLTSGSNNVYIANPGFANESGKIRIGTDANQNAIVLASVWGKTIGGPTRAVVVNKSGRLGTAPAPAAPLSGQSRTLDRLRAQNRRQSNQLRELRAAVDRLRAQAHSQRPGG